MVLADLANEIMCRPRDQNLWRGPVHFSAQGYDKMANVIYHSMKDHVGSVTRKRLELNEVIASEYKQFKFFWS